MSAVIWHTIIRHVKPLVRSGEPRQTVDVKEWMATMDVRVDELRVDRSTKTLRERTVERLRDAILNFQFKAGERLVERSLCEKLGVSRTVVREALRQLEAEGLVENLPQHGPA